MAMARTSTLAPASLATKTKQTARRRYARELVIGARPLDSMSLVVAGVSGLQPPLKG